MATQARDAAPKKNTQLMTPEFRVSFPAVFTPRAAVEGQEKKYSITMLFDKKTDLTALKQAVASVLAEKYGPDKAKWPKGLRLPFRDGSEKDYSGYENVIFASATSKIKPGVVDQNVQPIIEPSEFYGGCYARATVNAYAYDVSGNKGVALGLRNVQKLRDGEAFSGKNDASKDFDAIPVPAGSAAEMADPLADIGA